MIALVLGGARSVWTDLAAAQALLAGRPHLTVACNFAGEEYPGHLDGWVSLHPDRFGQWLRNRRRIGGNEPRLFGHVGHAEAPQIEVVAERWGGSSGLYAVQVAISHLGARGVILCGVPLDQDAGHIRRPGSWCTPTRYRSGFRAAATAIGPSVRSMGGWTAELFGQPDGDWLTERARAQA